MIWTAAYLSSIVVVNVIFHHVPWVGSFIVGGIFILRDFAQREIGHRVLLVTVLGIGISYVMADPFVATASALAFALGGLTDWLAFTLAGRAGMDFRQRVLVSSSLSVPVDSAVFLLGLGFFRWGAFFIQCASKAVALSVLWLPRRTPEVA